MICLWGYSKNSIYIISDVKKLEFAGFDGIHLIIGNNYYLSRIMDSFENQRTDDYDGYTYNLLNFKYNNC